MDSYLHSLFADSSVRRSVLDEITRRPNVRAVFVGRRFASGRWDDAEAVSVHVSRKVPRGSLSARALIPSAIDGIPTDVLEVRKPRAQFLDVLDPAAGVSWQNRRRKPGTLTAIRSEGSRLIALMAGHSALPYDSPRTIARAYRAGSPTGPNTVGVDTDAGATTGGMVLTGYIGGPYDFAVVEFPVIPFDASHPGVGGRTAPYVVRSMYSVGPAEELHFQSRFDGPQVARRGTIQGYPLTGVPVALPDGTTAVYHGLCSVMGIGSTFSRPGDSGALVADSSSRAVGTIVAGDAGSGLSFVLPIEQQAAAMGAYYQRFFV